MGLIAMGAPEDEYDPEVEDLVRGRGALTAERVHEIFIHWFGDYSGVLTADQAEQIADGVNAAYVAHMT